MRRGGTRGEGGSDGGGEEWAAQAPTHGRRSGVLLGSQISLTWLTGRGEGDEVAEAGKT